ncbi:MAG: hypothetical protein WC071_12295, partial [Victivallaceae bacterium]
RKETLSVVRTTLRLLKIQSGTGAPQSKDASRQNKNQNFFALYRLRVKRFIFFVRHGRGLQKEISSETDEATPDT